MFLGSIPSFPRPDHSAPDWPLILDSWELSQTPSPFLVGGSCLVIAILLPWTQVSSQWWCFYLLGSISNIGSICALMPASHLSAFPTPSSLPTCPLTTSFSYLGSSFLRSSLDHALSSQLHFPESRRTIYSPSSHPSSTVRLIPGSNPPFQPPLPSAQRCPAKSRDRSACLIFLPPFSKVDLKHQQHGSVS